MIRECDLNQEFLDFDEMKLEVRGNPSSVVVMSSRHDISTDICVNRFVEYQRSVRSFSENTVQSYIQDLSQFAQFLWPAEDFCPPFKWEKVTTPGARGFLVKFHRNGNAPATTRRKLASLRSFFNFLKDEKIVKINL